MATSLPITWAHHGQRLALRGLTLPGIMEEPGSCRDNSSPMPLRGRMTAYAHRWQSYEAHATVFNAPCASTMHRAPQGFKLIFRRHKGKAGERGNMFRYIHIITSGC